jgi:hypothetical protein
MEREQLIRRIADSCCDRSATPRLHEAYESYAKIVLAALDRLGYEVRPRAGVVSEGTP